MLESGLLREAGDRYALAGPLPPLAIPATLHDSLLARLDRLGAGQGGGADRRRASAGSSRYELLAAVAPRPPDAAAAGARAAGRGRAGLPARRAAGGAATRSSTRWCRTPPTAAAAQPAPAAPRPDRARSGGAFSGGRERAAGAARASPHASGPGRTGGRLLAEGGGAGDRAFRPGGSGRSTSRRPWACWPSCPTRSTAGGASSSCRLPSVRPRRNEGHDASPQANGPGGEPASSVPRACRSLPRPSARCAGTLRLIR